MKVTVSRRGRALDMEVTIEEIPNEDKLASLDINFQDSTVNLYYEGWRPMSYSMTPVDGEVLSADAATTTYDGELDPPGVSSLVSSKPEIGGTMPPRRAVRDSPQA